MIIPHSEFRISRSVAFLTGPIAGSGSKGLFSADASDAGTPGDEVFISSAMHVGQEPSSLKNGSS
jgi:hypothetical protein